MRLNDNNTFIGINPPYQLSVIHSSKLIYPREIYQLGEEIYCEALRHIVEAWEGRPDSLQQVGDLSVPEYLTRWLRESVMNLSPDTYGRYAYDMGRVIIPYFERKRLSLKALTPRDLETFFRYERQQEEATVQQLLDWHKELTDALQYAVANNWLKVSPIKEVDPCLDNSPVLFTDFITDWLKMMKSRVEITTYASYERAIIHKIVPYFEPLHYTLQDMEQHPKYIQDFYQHELDRGLTANTVIHYHANIRKCLQYAFQIGMIRSNPADRVERPRKEKFKSEIYSGEELEQLFKVIQGDPSEFGVIMAAFYGLRRSEIVGLKWDAIDFENKKISIQHTVVTAKVNGTVTEIARDKTKTKSSCRTLPLIPACEQMLNNWVTVTSAQQATFIHIWIFPARYLLPMPSSGSSRRRQKCENEPDAGDKKEKQPKILRF